MVLPLIGALGGAAISAWGANRAASKQAKAAEDAGRLGADAARAAVTPAEEALRRAAALRLDANRGIHDANLRAGNVRRDETVNALRGVMDRGVGGAAQAYGYQREGLDAALDAQLAAARGVAGAQDAAARRAGNLAVGAAGDAGALGVDAAGAQRRALAEAIRGGTQAGEAAANRAADRLVAGAEFGEGQGRKLLRDARNVRDAGLEGLSPYRAAGGNALAGYLSEMGMGVAPEGFTGYERSPGYEFRMREGLDAVEGSAAASGGLRSGATMRALNEYAQGVAAQDHGAYLDRLLGLADRGRLAEDAAAGLQQGFMANSGVARDRIAGAGADRARALADRATTVGELRMEREAALGAARADAIGARADARVGEAEAIAAARMAEAQRRADVEAAFGERRGDLRSGYANALAGARTDRMEARIGAQDAYGRAAADARIGFADTLGQSRVARLEADAAAREAEALGIGQARVGGITGSADALTAGMTDAAAARAAGTAGIANALTGSVNNLMTLYQLNRPDPYAPAPPPPDPNAAPLPWWRRFG